MTEPPTPAQIDAAAENTDRELWRGPDEGNGSFYADSIHVTNDGGIGMNCGGLVFVKSIRKWHALAAAAEVEMKWDRGVENRAYPKKTKLEKEIELLRADNDRLRKVSGATDTAAAEVGSRRVLQEVQSFCPSCGHNRDKSSVSSIDHGSFKSCQKCGAEWTEAAEVGRPPPHHATDQASTPPSAGDIIPAAEVAWPSQELVNDLVVSATEEDTATVHYPLGRTAAAVSPTTEPPTMIEYCEHLNRMLRDRAAERERCAQVADKYIAKNNSETINDTRHNIAAAIRANKEKP